MGLLSPITINADTTRTHNISEGMCQTFVINAICHVNML